MPVPGHTACSLHDPPAVAAWRAGAGGAAAALSMLHTPVAPRAVVPDAITPMITLVPSTLRMARDVPSSTATHCGSGQRTARVKGPHPKAGNAGSTLVQPASAGGPRGGEG